MSEFFTGRRIFHGSAPVSSGLSCDRKNEDSLHVSQKECAGQAVGRRLVKECSGSPLAIKLLTPLLEGSTRERKWKDLLAELSALSQYLTFKVRIENHSCPHREVAALGESHMALLLK